MPFDDDAEADNPGFRPPPHPDDRLWRHPSEMRAHPIVPLGAPSGQVSAVVTTHRSSILRNRWVCVSAAALAGAAAASVGVVTLGLGQRVIERPVTERVALGPTAPTVGDPADDGIASVQARVSPAVVAVGPGLDGGDGDAATGSGVVVRDDGIVVTSAALVGDGPTPVRLADGTTTSADLVGADPTTGLAVLDLAGTGYATAVLAGESSLREGETAYTLDGRAAPGDPAGPAEGAAGANGANADGSTTGAGTGAGAPGAGVAPDELAVADGPSGTEATPDAGAGDAAIGTGLVVTTQRYVGPSGIALDGLAVEGDADPATLGGPVVNGRGALVGIVTAVQEGDTWYVAPVEVVDKVADDLLTFGQVHHGWLGIEGTDVPIAIPTTPTDGADGTDAGGTGDPAAATGTRVASVVPDSPADRGGLQPGDVIVAVDDTAVGHMPDLVVALRSRSPGDRVDVTVARADGSQATLVLTLAEPRPPGPGP